jgi:CHASE3 domain sensor protein
MIASNHQGDADFPFVPERAARNEEAVLALTKAQKLAASRLAIAQGVLEQAHQLEVQLSNERNAISGYLAAADAAHAGEREASERVQRAREQIESLAALRAEELRKHEELRHAEELARADLVAAEERLVLARQALDAAAGAYANDRATTVSIDERETETRSELESAVRSLDEFNRARAEADAAVEEICARLELLSGGSLSAEAVIRVVERRTADMLRHEAKYGTT